MSSPKTTSWRYASHNFHDKTRFSLQAARCSSDLHMSGSKHVQAPCCMPLISCRDILRLHVGVVCQGERILPAVQLTKADFDLPTLAPKLRALGKEVSQGKGFHLVRRFIENVSGQRTRTGGLNLTKPHLMGATCSLVCWAFFMTISLVCWVV